MVCKLKPVHRESSRNRRLPHICVNSVWEKGSLALPMVATEGERERRRGKVTNKHTDKLMY